MVNVGDKDIENYYKLMGLVDLDRAIDEMGTWTCTWVVNQFTKGEYENLIDDLYKNDVFFYIIYNSFHRNTWYVGEQYEEGYVKTIVDREGQMKKVYIKLIKEGEELLNLYDVELEDIKVLIKKRVELIIEELDRKYIQKNNPRFYNSVERRMDEVLSFAHTLDEAGYLTQKGSTYQEMREYIKEVINEDIDKRIKGTGREKTRNQIRELYLRLIHIETDYLGLTR